MDDDFDAYQDEEDFTPSLNRFEQMLKNNEHYFFDVEEFEVLIEHYLGSNEKEKAKKALEFSLKQHPTATTLKLKKAQFLAFIHKPNKALEVLAEVEFLEPFNNEVHYIKANIHSQLRQHKKAIENYYKAIKLIDDKVEKTNVYLNIAFEHENLEQYDKAISILKDLLLENPGNETVLYEIAFCYNLKDDVDSCIKFFKEFIDDNPFSYSAWYNLGIAYNKAILFEKAIDAYDFAIAIKPEFSSAYFNKANSLAHLEKYTEAISTFKETFLFEEPDATTHYYIGECYEKQENNDKALIHYEKATELDPYYADAWAGLSVINDYLEKPQSAIHYVEKALELDNGNSEYWYIYGDLLAKQALVEDAVTAFLKVVELDEDNEEIWIDISEVVAEKESIEKGIIYIYEGLEKQPKNFALYARLVAYLLKIGKINEAKQNLLIVLENNNNLLADIIEYYPEIVDHSDIIEIIENYKK